MLLARGVTGCSTRVWPTTASPGDLPEDPPRWDKTLLSFLLNFARRFWNQTWKQLVLCESRESKDLQNLQHFIKEDAKKKLYGWIWLKWSIPLILVVKKTNAPVIGVTTALPGRWMIFWRQSNQCKKWAETPTLKRLLKNPLHWFRTVVYLHTSFA